MSDGASALWHAISIARQRAKEKKKRRESKNENNWSADHIERNKKEREVFDYFMPHCQSTCAHDLDYFGMGDCRRAAHAVSDEDYYGEEVEKEKRKVEEVLGVVLFCFVVTACRIEPSCEGDSFNSFNSSDYETACLWR